MLKYKDYKLIKLSKSIEKQINNLIITNNGSVFHEPLLNKIISDKYNTDLYYLVDNPENIQHASVVHITKNKLGLKRYNLRPLADIPYSGFIGTGEVNFDELNVGSHESVSYVGFPYFKNLKSNITIGKTAMVSLDVSEDDIFTRSIHSKRRNMIRKAIRSGISVKIYNNLEGFDLFWPVLSELHQKLGYYDLDYHYYKNILEAYFRTNQAFVFLANKKNELISGIIMIGNKNYMHYYKGASKMGVKNEGQGELLQWEAIKHAKQLSAKFYDLCNLNKNKLPHIYRFKTGISNSIYNYPIYSHNAFFYKVANKLIKVL